jgi:hypothetical protein
MPTTGKIFFRRQQAAAFSGATWNVVSTGPISMGFVAPEGELLTSQSLDVGGVSAQVDVQNTWADGSVRHGVASFVATGTGNKTVTAISGIGGSHTPTWPSASIAIAVTSGAGSGNTYTATLPAFDGTNTTLNGSVCRRAWVKVNPVNGATPHAHLQCFFEVTSYAAGGHVVDCIIQNTQNVTAMDEVTYDVTITVAGSSIYTQSGHRQFTGTMYHKAGVTGTTLAVVNHDFALWQRAKVIPTIVEADAETYNLADTKYQWGAGGSSGADFGNMDRNQANSGGSQRYDIQHINKWDAQLFYFGTEAYRLVSLANGDSYCEWTMGITQTDGVTILRTTEAAYAAMCTDVQISNGITPYTNWQVHGGGGWYKGIRYGGYADVNPTNVNNEHMAEAAFIPYLLTGSFLLIERLRMAGGGAAMIVGNGSVAANSTFFPGLMRGRDESTPGLEAIVSNSGVTREFATPLKCVWRAAFGMPDSDTTSQSYLKMSTENNLNYLGYWARWHYDNNYGGDLNAWGFEAINQFFTRSNSVTGTTSGATTTLTVIGDDAGHASDNDHGMLTGDIVTLSGFTGANTELNGDHAITRLSATTFSVAVDTTGNASGTGTWTTYTGLYIGPWRLSFTAVQAYNALSTGYFTADADAYAFVDGCATMATQCNITLSDAEFAAQPGATCNFYPVFARVRAGALVYYNDMTDVVTANSRNLSTAALIHDEAYYSANGGVFNTYHRGNGSWNNTDFAYPQHANGLYRLGVKRGIAGASTALARYLALSGHPAEMSAQPGMNLSWDY